MPQNTDGREKEIQMKNWNETGKPVLVLLIICLVSSFLLAEVDLLTKDYIAENIKESTYTVYYQVLPEADTFEELPCNMEGVTAVLKAKNGAGYVITAQGRGYGGAVPAAVSFDSDGNILKTIMMANSETPGLGQKVTLASFYGQFSDIPAENFALDDIDAVSGATISSRASVTAINRAIDAYHQVCRG